MIKKQVIVIGGGASGLMCALVASLNGVKVTILEADVKVGKKILASGNGRCNFTNDNILENSYNVDISNFLKKFNSADAINFFEQLGLVSYADSEGRRYPKSNLSSSVLDVMVNALNNNYVEIITQTKANQIIKGDSGYKIITNNGEYTCEKVVVCVGGNALNNMLTNVSVQPFVPSLCALKTSNKIKELSGIRVPNVKVSLELNSKTFIEFGEVLFKDNGVGGICVMNLSAFMARNNLNSAKLSINLLPDLEFNCLINMLTKRKQILKNNSIKQFFVGLFHKNLGYEILNRAKVNYNISVNNLSDNQILELAKIISDFSLDVVGFYDNNQVHCGGVNLSDLTSNLESKQNKNLFVCGEANNVDGLCGGYNLQWAWTSGYIVGKSL